MAKSDKIDGGRWLRGNAISEGGQGAVYRATDTTGILSGEYALKRVHNATRHARFRAEVEAVKRLDHPNIIKLIDHSALDADAPDVAAKQFLVMPLAAGGHLGDPDRLALYQGNLDSTIIAALQLADALAAAHKANVVHRDVKPQNILFTGHGHDLWLSDFGICLIRDAPRVTPDDEVVGPSGFIAPECEDGGQLDVDGRADIYSLGKVIYYMLSGGRIIPREKIAEAQYADLFAHGARHQQLHLLLQQMISARDARLATMGEVKERLERIKSWEAQALIPPTTSAGHDMIARLRQRAVATERVSSENAKARAEETSVRASARTLVEDFLQAELEKLANDLRAGGALIADVAETDIAGVQQMHFAPRAWYDPLGGRTLSLATSPRYPESRHLLHLLLCEERRMTTTVRQGPRQPEDDLMPARDIRFAVVACYGQSGDGAGAYERMQGFLSRRNTVGQNKQVMSEVQARTPIKTYHIHQVMKSYIGGVALAENFAAAEWPIGAGQVRQLIGQASETFFAQVESQSPFIGD